MISLRQLQQARSDFDWKFAHFAAENQYVSLTALSELFGVSLEQAELAKQVWRKFRNSGAARLPDIRFEHCAAVLTCRDSRECLQWASENEATVAEMREWRGLQRGEDVTEAACEPH